MKTIKSINEFVYYKKGPIMTVYSLPNWKGKEMSSNVKNVLVDSSSSAGSHTHDIVSVRFSSSSSS